MGYRGIIPFVYVGEEEMSICNKSLYDCQYAQDSKSKKSTKMAAI